MKRRTKIVCTLGPSVDGEEQIRALIDAGMNVARINCSHGDWPTRRRWIEIVRRLSSDVAPIGILADLQGPKFRIGDLPPDGIELRPGQTVTLGPSGGAEIPIDQPEILRAMTPGARLLLGDGELELKIGAARSGGFEARVVSGGTLRGRKGVTLVNKLFDTPALTPKDLEDAREAVDAGVDFIALSYVRHAADVRELRRAVEPLDPSVHLCAKIETREAVRDLENILKAVDLVMVARGDLGLQADIEEVPLMQKRIIDACTRAGRPVITATQMLESMMVNPRPTRAEASDVANAILDGSDALMLSGETAAGAHPVEAVRTMARIAEATEPHERIRSEREPLCDGDDHTDAIAHAATSLAHRLRPRAILTTSTSGQTPRLVSKFRPRIPILCATWVQRTQRQLAVVWGVEALHVERPASTDEAIQRAIDAFLRKRRLNCGDLVVVTAGVPPGAAGGTNLILTEVVK